MSDQEYDEAGTPERTGSPRDRIETLLRATGKRPAVPGDRTERVKAAVRSHWRSEIARRTGWLQTWGFKALAAAAMFLAAVGIVLWFLPGVSPVSRTAARVEKVAGAAFARKGSDSGADRPVPLHEGNVIPAGWMLATSADGRVALRMASGHGVRMDSHSRVRVTSADTLALVRGAVYVDSHEGKEAAEGRLKIRTPLGSVVDTGTRFEVRLLDDALRIRVREGSVALEHDGDRLAVRAGDELDVLQDGRTVRRPIVPSDGAWDWVASITPMMEIDGRPLRAFLAWQARERGLRLEFADETLARAAAESTLSGSVTGMSLDEALDSVLATCDMRHRIEHGALLVESARGVPARPD